MWWLQHYLRQPSSCWAYCDIMKPHMAVVLLWETALLDVL